MKNGEFFPISKASEVLGERWTLLILRELSAGSTRYTELQRGLGRISPSVLSSRIRTLMDHGIVERAPSDSPQCSEYRLTESGVELAPIIGSISSWSQRWVRSRMTSEELDVELLMRRVQEGFDAGAFPRECAVIAFVFSDLYGATRRWWLLLDDGETELSAQPTGRAEDVVISCEHRTLDEIFRGDLALDTALASRRIIVAGCADLVSRVSRWFSVPADVEPRRAQKQSSLQMPSSPAQRPPTQ